MLSTILSLKKPAVHNLPPKSELFSPDSNLAPVSFFDEIVSNIRREKIRGGNGEYELWVLFLHEDSCLAA